MRKLEGDTHGVQEYATLGRAQCYSSVFGLEEKYDDTEGFEGSDLFFAADIDLANSQSPLFLLTSSKALKTSLVDYIKTWRKPFYSSSPAYQKGYSKNYRETENCEKRFDANNKALYQSYLKFVRSLDSYEKPKSDENPYAWTAETIEKQYDNYLKYYIEYVEPEGCPLGKKEWC